MWRFTSQVKIYWASVGPQSSRSTSKQPPEQHGPSRHYFVPIEAKTQAAAIGFCDRHIYGDRGDETITEDSMGGSGYLSEVCKKYDNATTPAQQA